MLVGESEAYHFLADLFGGQEIELHIDVVSWVDRFNFFAQSTVLALHAFEVNIFRPSFLAVVFETDVPGETSLLLDHDFFDGLSFEASIQRFFPVNEIFEFTECLGGKSEGLDRILDPIFFVEVWLFRGLGVVRSPVLRTLLRFKIYLLLF